MEEITTEELEDFIYLALLDGGFIPEQQELYAIADVLFDFLIHKGIIIEE